MQAPDRFDEAEVEQSVMFIKSKNKTDGHKEAERLRETHETGGRKQLKLIKDTILSK